MERTNIYLTESEVAALDGLAGALGVSRAEMVRRMVDRGLGTEAGTDLDADILAIEESFGALRGVRLRARGPDARARHLERIAAR